MKNNLLIPIFLSLLLPIGTLAQAIRIENPLEAESFEEIIDNIIDFIFTIAIVVTPLMVIWAAFLFVTSAGNIDQVNQAKRIIIYTLTGLAIVLLAKGFVAIMKQLLEV